MAGPSGICSFEELIQSEPFTFYIGKARKEFVVHSKAIAATSWHFHALVNNGMAQSQKRSVEYPDMEPEDFARYVEYAYRYDYTVPHWTLDDPHSKIIESDVDVEEGLVSEEPEPEPVVEPETGVNVFGPGFGSRAPRPFTNESTAINSWSKKKKKSATSRATLNLRRSFDERGYLTSDEPSATMLAEFLPKENSKPEQNFTPIFLAHAHLYTFACMRLIDPLKRLALHKLHHTLLKFKLYDRRVSDVVELARYAYDNGEDRKPDGTIEDLRKLVVEYIACEVSTIGKHEAFAPLLQEGGEFVVDFWRIIAKENLSL
ncbi:hypothetical protein J4E93_001731 [Alternaria ventricosa]|uniref:uncharacterized protein n=1 Tax=Alternaria ventricosa TaxID=1187951 RepID=UPI0020C3A267|nr:uncharacterized protein J4E93_001731 [Alternaria ventricosa]KAI4653963.1 hypothetical protein J4E93_001731 [Alternaria ventricosa]